MSSSNFLTSLNMGTLLIVLGVAVVVLLLFLRRPSHRHPLDGREERNVAADLDEGREPPDHSPRG